MTKRYYKSAIFIILSVFIITACEDDDNKVSPKPGFDIPGSYNFDNVDYSGQTARIQMLDLLSKTVKSAHDGQTKVTADELIAIYENTSGDLFGTSKDMASKTFDGDGRTKQMFYDYFSEVEAISGNADNIIDGRLFNAEGIEPAQMIEKGLMGALLYYQAVSFYLSPEQMNVDNTQVEEGKGTDMEHHWDEAFGYFGAPKDFKNFDDSSNEKAWFWANYSLDRNEHIDAKEKIFEAFLKGRAAISAGNMVARDEAIGTILKNWELLVAANVVHYINSTIADLKANATGDMYHHWSEGKAFLNALKYNQEKTITNEQLAELNEFFTDSPKKVSEEDLVKANVKLQEIFGFSNQQMLNL